MKTNFKKSQNELSNKTFNEFDSSGKELTKEEFENYIMNSGAKGSFMVYRTNNKEEELGLDEL